MLRRTLFASLRAARREGFYGARRGSFRDVTVASRHLSLPPNRMQISEEVQSALASGKPVVALETAILTHGLPPPHNLDCAFAVEARIRAEGALPATVGMLDGRLIVGLLPAELARLAEASEKKEALKISRRDVAVGLAKGVAGGTTVSGTMLAANLAGISVFVTGGIGGVHRGGEQTLDISADLTELGRTPVTVICAGCKSILDIGRTLEYLETQGVPTIVLGNGLSFPAFFVADSGFKGSHSVSTPKEVAEIVSHNISLGLDSGLVVGVPIPREAAADGQLVEGAIQQALHEAEKGSVTGSGITPFVLSRVNELTKGKSLAANLALIKNNAKIGAQVAKELCSIRKSSAGGNESWEEGCFQPGRGSLSGSSGSSQQPPGITSLPPAFTQSFCGRETNYVEVSKHPNSSTNISAEAMQQEMDDEFLRLAGQPCGQTSESIPPFHYSGSSSGPSARFLHTAVPPHRYFSTWIRHPPSLQLVSTGGNVRDMLRMLTLDTRNHAGVAKKRDAEHQQDSLSGLSFYLSGSPVMKDEARRDIESCGGKVVHQLSSAVDYVVDCGGEAGPDETTNFAQARSVAVISKSCLHHLVKPSGESVMVTDSERSSLSQALQRNCNTLVEQVQRMEKWWNILLVSDSLGSTFAVSEAARALTKAVEGICSRFIVDESLGDATLNSEIGKPSSSSAGKENGLVVIGAAISDLIARASDGNIQLNMTNPSTLSRAFGGVGRNVAEATIRFGTQPLFLSAVGDDFIHHDLLHHWTKTLGADGSGIRVVTGEQTSVYVAVLHQSGELHSGLGSFHVLRYISPEWLDKFKNELTSAKVVCFDGNLSTDTIAHICEMCGAAGVPIWFEPTDTRKAKKPFSSPSWQHISLVSPNVFELQSMAKAAVESESCSVTPGQVAALSAESTNLGILDKLQLCKNLAPLLLQHVPWLLVTLGYHGTVLITSQPMDADQSWLDQLSTRGMPREECHATWFDVFNDKKTRNIVSVSGAGDSLAGAALAGITQGWTISKCVANGLWAAQQSLSTVLPVNPEICHDTFNLHCDSLLSNFVNVHTGWNDIMTAAGNCS